MTAYRGFQEQAFHYFMRPHDAVPDGEVKSPADWRGPDMAARQNKWLFELTPDHIAEIKSAAEDLMSRGVSMADVTRDMFNLPTLAPEISKWRSEISRGRGFVVVRGLPVAEWGDAFSAYAYWGIGHHLGHPGAQNPQNELLGHVVDYGEEIDNPVVRRYRTTGNIDFHCDAADAVGLLCLRPARSGGQSRIVSSVAVYNEARRRAPEMTARLFEPFCLDRRDEQPEGQPGYIPIPPCRWSEAGGLKTFYHSEYFRSAARHPEIEIDTPAAQLLDMYDEICASPEFQLDMWLEPGDMQFISNHTILHARTRYQDHADPAMKRHLLRLWLSI